MSELPTLFQIAQSRRDASVCAECGNGIGPGEPVEIVRLMHLEASWRDWTVNRRRLVAICRKCSNVRQEAIDDMFNEWVWPRTCDCCSAHEGTSGPGVVPGLLRSLALFNCSPASAARSSGSIRSRQSRDRAAEACGAGEG